MKNLYILFQNLDLMIVLLQPTDLCLQLQFFQKANLMITFTCVLQKKSRRYFVFTVLQYSNMLFILIILKHLYFLEI